MPLSPGERLGPYKILAAIGAGGMGEVYKALDTRLDRTVAIKVLPEHIARRADLRARFEREARTVASLNHPHICVLYDIGASDGVGGYMVMEYLEGETLAARIRRGPLPLQEALTFAIQITDALDRAHQSGITHRDVKPQNIMLTRDGVKVLDFGLSKSAPKASPGAADEMVTQTLAAEQTNPGTVMGTVAYMSPEQAEGKALDDRSDVFSTGVVIYEMLAGARPFQGRSALSLMSSILRDQPEPLDHRVEGVPAEVSNLVAHCLEKEKESRCSAAEVSSGLASYLQSQRAATHTAASKSKSRPGLRIALAVAAVVLAMLGAWWFRQQSRVRWAQQQLPRVSELAANGSFNAAFNLLQEVESQDPANSELHRLWGEVSRDIFLSSNPPGVDVFRKDLEAPDTDWRLVGTTPMKNVKVPRGYYQLKFSGPNVETSLDASSNNSAEQTYRLSPKRPPEPGMVLINPSRRTLDISGVGNVAIDRLPTFWMDATEVTNRDFKKFIDQGGYQGKSDFQSFLDPTGRPGPSTWEAGTYRAGQDDFAVTGVSWFEADAYCAAQGKQLPTLHHWYRASDPALVAYVLKAANYNGTGVAKVGSRGERGPFGTQDLAGNAREWVSNATGDGRNYILGGSWRDSGYMYNLPTAANPADRSDTNGFRCMKVTEPLASEFAAPLRQREQPVRSEPPISDETFRAYQRIYAYDPGDLSPTVDSTDSTPSDWTRVNLSYRAAYARARIPAYLFLPKNARPPYQAVIFMGGANMFTSASSEPPVDFPVLDYILRSGRAVLYPIFTGTYERRNEQSRNTLVQERDFFTRFVQDVMRSVDYLRSRSDIVGDKIGYTGKSYGSAFAPTVLALEPRLKAAVLLDGGRFGDFRIAEADPYFFAPRVRTPVLMLNGGQDFTFPVEASQVPLFQALGVPASQKQHLVFDAGHDVSSRYRLQVVREALNWWDRHLGPVQ